MSKICHVRPMWGCDVHRAPNIKILKTVFGALDHWHLVLSRFGFFTLVSVEVLYHIAHYLLLV